MKMVARVHFISILKHFGKLDEDLCQLVSFSGSCIEQDDF